MTSNGGSRPSGLRILFQEHDQFRWLFDYRRFREQRSYPMVLVRIAEQVFHGMFDDMDEDFFTVEAIGVLFSSMDAASDHQLYSSMLMKCAGSIYDGMSVNELDDENVVWRPVLAGAIEAAGLKEEIREEEDKDGIIWLRSGPRLEQQYGIRIEIDIDVRDDLRPGPDD